MVIWNLTLVYSNWHFREQLLVLPCFLLVAGGGGGVQEVPQWELLVVISWCRLLEGLLSYWSLVVHGQIFSYRSSLSSRYYLWVESLLMVLTDSFLHGFHVCPQQTYSFVPCSVEVQWVPTWPVFTLPQYTVQVSLPFGSFSGIHQLKEPTSPKFQTNPPNPPYSMSLFFFFSLKLCHLFRKGVRSIPFTSPGWGVGIYSFFYSCLKRNISLLVSPLNQYSLSVHFSWVIPLWLSWQRICLQCRRPGFDPWVWKIPWRREWLLTPVFLPGEFHGL